MNKHTCGSDYQEPIWLQHDLGKNEHPEGQIGFIIDFLENSIATHSIEAFIQVLKHKSEDNLYAYRFYKSMIEYISDTEFETLDPSQIQNLEEQLKYDLLNKNQDSLRQLCLNILKQDSNLYTIGYGKSVTNNMIRPSQIATEDTKQRTESVYLVDFPPGTTIDEIEAQMISQREFLIASKGCLFYQKFCHLSLGYMIENRIYNKITHNTFIRLLHDYGKLKIHSDMIYEVGPRAMDTSYTIPDYYDMSYDLLSNLVAFLLGETQDLNQIKTLPYCDEVTTH